MVDLDNLLAWPVDKVVSAEGFLCKCGNEEVVAFRTISLRDKMRKLLQYPPEHSKYSFLFGKVLKKAEGVNKRGDRLWHARM